MVRLSNVARALGLTCALAPLGCSFAPVRGSERAVDLVDAGASFQQGYRLGVVALHVRTVTIRQRLSVESYFNGTPVIFGDQLFVALFREGGLTAFGPDLAR